MTSRAAKRIKSRPSRKTSARAEAFVFSGYRHTPWTRHIELRYRIEFSDGRSLDFKEVVVLPRKSVRLKRTELAKFLEPLHLIMGISYYKTYCPPKIVLPYALTKDQAAFWGTVYRKGLGEYIYRNKIDPKRLAKFPHTAKGSAPVRLDARERALLGIGGGKDSIVAAELLKAEKYPTTSFLVETQKEDAVTRRVVEKIGFGQLAIRRYLDPKLFSGLPGSYNGHVPISAIIAFLGLLTAGLYDYRYVMVGNEQSSNFGNLRYKGETINHQWSKSAEFEAMFQDYTRRFITPDITYFSPLRSFYEIRVAKMFSQYEKYLPLFTSCNRNFTVHKERPKTLWCGECPKCAFVYLMLAPFAPKQRLIKTFGKNLLADEKLLPMYRDLLGFGQLKPFDCVGTFDESRAALYMASKKYRDDIVVKTFLKRLKRPQETAKRVMRTVQAPTVPTPFRFLGMKSVCILGYAKEGKVTERFLRRYHPRLKVGILDKKRGPDYLARQVEYDLAIKTPGIPKTKVTIPYTTATNIFFSHVKNRTIGVTGTKGKSTTVSLIRDMLKAGGKKVRLLGNIGNPMLEVLLHKADPQEIFVIELSSYMLDDIEYSPHVAVLLNLFPEHMPYHGGVENYYRAKQNVFRFQAEGDVAIRPPFRARIPLEASGIPLKGQHNLHNIKAAIQVARHFGISDQAIAQAIREFRPLPHRLQFIGNYRGIDFYDDAISTTPESTMMAIKTLKRIGTIFLGGEDRGYDFRQLERTVRRYAIKNIVLFPDSGRRILGSRRGLNVLETRNMGQAVAFAFRYTPPGTICLLSTASPSYSLWKNFEEKGDLFRKMAQETGTRHSGLDRTL